MFYCNEILSLDKGGTFGILWLAANHSNTATLTKRLGKKPVISISISECCTSILNPEVAMALRLKASLLIGVSRIYAYQWKSFFRDVEQFHSRVIELHPNSKKTTRKLQMQSIEATQLSTEIQSPALLLPEVNASFFPTLLEHEYLSRILVDDTHNNSVEQPRKKDSFISMRSSLISDYSSNIEQFGSFGFANDANMNEFGLNIDSSLKENHEIYPLEISIPSSESIYERKKRKRGFKPDKKIQFTENEFLEECDKVQNLILAQQRFILAMANTRPDEGKLCEELFGLCLNVKNTHNAFLKKQLCISHSDESIASFGGGFSESSNLTFSIEKPRMPRDGAQFSPLISSSLDVWSSPFKEFPSRRTPSISPVSITNDLFHEYLFVQNDDCKMTTFKDCIKDDANKKKVAGLFSILLEYCNSNIVKVIQDMPFDEIFVRYNDK